MIYYALSSRAMFVCFRNSFCIHCARERSTWDVYAEWMSIKLQALKNAISLQKEVNWKEEKMRRVGGFKKLFIVKKEFLSKIHDILGFFTFLKKYIFWRM